MALFSRNFRPNFTKEKKRSLSQFIYDYGLVATLDNPQKLKEIKDVIIHELTLRRADPNLADYRGRTPLDLAAHWDFYQIIKVLVTVKAKETPATNMDPVNPNGDVGSFIFFLSPPRPLSFSFSLSSPSLLLSSSPSSLTDTPGNMHRQETHENRAYPAQVWSDCP